MLLFKYIKILIFKIRRKYWTFYVKTQVCIVLLIAT